MRLKIMLTALALSLAAVAGAWAALLPGQCSGRADVLALTGLARGGHFPQPVYRRVGSLSVGTRRSPGGCAPCGQSLQALRNRAHERFALGKTPFVLRFR